MVVAHTTIVTYPRSRVQWVGPFHYLKLLWLLSLAGNARPDYITNGVSLGQTEHNTSTLQTKISYREGYEARCVRLETMPLDQHIEDGHSEREPRLKIRPPAVHDFLEVADEREHRKDRLHQHTILPRAARTQFEVGRIAFRGMEGGITQDNHTSIKLLNQPLKGIIRDVRGGTRPSHDQSPLIQ